MNLDDVKRRAHALKAEVAAKQASLNAGEISAKQFQQYIDNAYTESQQLEVLQDRFQKAGVIMGAQEAAFGGQENLPASVLDTKAFGVGARSNPSSPMDITPTQLQALSMAMKAKTPFAIEVGAKGGLEQAWVSQVQTKSPTLEGGITGTPFSGQLPGIQTPYAVSLPYEPTRISAWMPGAVMAGPSAIWMQHVSNTNEAAGVGEAQTKPDLGPVFAEHQTLPQKIAALCSFSLELMQDTSEYAEASVMSWLPQELTRSLINTESAYLLLATTGGSNTFSGGPVNATFPGFMNVSGTLTRSVGTDTAIDALQKAAIDLRTSSGAYAEPDLLIAHPTTMGAIRRSKDADGRYVLDLLQGPLALTADGSPRTNTPPNEFNRYSVIAQGGGTSYGNIWGIPVVESTQMPAGYALMMSIRAGAGVFWQRLGLRLEYNPGFSDTMWSTNTYGFRVEERIALSVPRPGAINLISGLPTS